MVAGIALVTKLKTEEIEAELLAHGRSVKEQWCAILASAAAKLHSLKCSQTEYDV